MDITRDDITLLHKLLHVAKADSTPEDFSRGMEILDNLYAAIARGERGELVIMPKESV